MGLLPGRCTNEMFCALGASGRVVRVPAGLPFICPLCGKTLAAPETKAPSRLVGVTMLGVGIALSVVVAFVGGIVLGVAGATKPATLAVVGQRGLHAQIQRHIAVLPALPPLRLGLSVRHVMNSHSGKRN
jgi:hypothetical protein